MILGVVIGHISLVGIGRIVGRIVGRIDRDYVVWTGVGRVRVWIENITEMFGFGRVLEIYQ